MEVKLIKLRIGSRREKFLEDKRIFNNFIKGCTAEATAVTRELEQREKRVKKMHSKVKNSIITIKDLKRGSIFRYKDEYFEARSKWRWDDFHGEPIPVRTACGRYFYDEDLKVEYVGKRVRYKK
mgnify:CR=1 FL=1